MTRGPGRRERADVGAASVLVVAVAGVLLLVGAALATVAALVVDHRSAQAAADLAALAGAGAAARGEPGCAAAGPVAEANGAELAWCRASGREVRLGVRVPGPGWLGLVADPTAEARAGPG